MPPAIAIAVAFDRLGGHRQFDLKTVADVCYFTTLHQVFSADRTRTQQSGTRTPTRVSVVTLGC